jgi:hypothetical protein
MVEPEKLKVQLHAPRGIKRSKIGGIIVVIAVIVIATVSASCFFILKRGGSTLSLPAGIIYSLPITITNNQSVATQAPFQQMVVVDSATYISHESPNLQNIEFFYSSGVVIPSWLESGNSSSSTSSIYWLNLANGIPAHSSITIYMGFASTTTNLFNAQTTGEAPQLSSVYGEYDIGARIFTVYANFGGSAMPVDWSLQGSASFVPAQGVKTVDGGAFEEGAVVYGKNMTGQNVAIESSTYYSGSADDQNIGFYASGTPSGVGGPTGGLAPSGYSATFNPYYGTSYLFHNGVSPALITSSTLPSTSKYSFQRVVVTPTSILWEFVSDPSQYYVGGVYSQLTKIYTYEGNISNSYGGLFFSSSTGAAASTQYLYWMRIRALPPNGVMPTAAV